MSTTIELQPRKRRKFSSDSTRHSEIETELEVESTDFKLAILASLHPDRTQEVLLDYLLAYDGSIEAVSSALSGANLKEGQEQRRKRSAATGHQTSLSSFATSDRSTSNGPRNLKTAVKKGRTLHLYTPEEIEAHCPCSIIHNFLPTEQADALTRELLAEQPTFRRERFILFDREVESPHSVRFYVNSRAEAIAQKTEYTYNGGKVTDVGQTPPQMLKVCDVVRDKVNEEIRRRIREYYPEGKKLKFQTEDQWAPNVSFVNCYDGGKESVGWHADQLTYLGPRAVIGSMSLGVAREFRVRRIVPQGKGSVDTADEQGQIAIHLPHNSLLIMHAEMQEEWKHCIAPAQVIDPHPLAGNKRFNITYRFYRDHLHPKFTPRCRCDVPCVLRCVQKRSATRGRYMWQCHAGYVPGQAGCSFFTWAEFDEDGRPPWVEAYKGNANLPVPLASRKDDDDENATLPMKEAV